MSGYTKGEWKLATYMDRTIIGPDGRTICIAHLRGNGHSEEESEANAHLIAAAPDMYEALADIKANCSDLLPDYYMAVLDAALAKANGHD